jgi:hypothetical protein
VLATYQKHSKLHNRVFNKGVLKSTKMTPRNLTFFLRIFVH